MRIINLLIALTIVSSVFGQGGPTCSEMEPICTNVGLNFTANAGVAQASSSDPGNDYDCLITQPNPSWYYLSISSSGNINMNLSAPSDIDFIIYGPFSSLSVAQAQCGDLGNPNAEIVDCSFSPTNNEFPTITGAVVGEVYVMLITNYADVVQDVVLQQVGGTGGTDCSIVTDPPCAMTAFNVNVGGCSFTTNTYDVTGSIEFTDPPLSGDLVVVNCAGVPQIVASAPFGAGPIPFSILNNPSDGLPCNISAYFTADPACTQSFSYTAPLCIANCPTYELQSSSPTEACGDQIYSLEIQNTECDGYVEFDVVGNYGSSFANEITWQVTSNLTSNIVASGGPGTNGANFNVSTGQLDPAVQGLVYTITISDSWGDGFNGTGGYITVQVDGVDLMVPITGNFGFGQSFIFQAPIVVSTTTMSVTTPSGVVTSVMGNCNDHEVSFLLDNANFCTPIEVDLPWTINCDNTGQLIASGIHTVIVYPQVPTQASDIVSVVWNASTCSWDISPNNDCDMFDLGSIFTISPDPTALSNYCANGNETFTVDYLGVSGSPNCCSTAGPAVPITYNITETKPDAVVANSFFGGTNNAAYMNVSGNGSGGNATSVSLTVAYNGYCENIVSTTGDDIWVTVFVDGIIIYDQVQTTTNFSQTFTLADMPFGYNENSVVEVYFTPNQLTATYNPGTACGSLPLNNWNVSGLTVTINAVFEQMIPTPVSCSLASLSPYTCCTITPLSADAPADVSVDCPANAPAVDVNSVTNIVSDCPTTVTHVSDVPSGSCPTSIARTYKVTDDCGDFIEVVQTIFINAPIVVMPANGSSTVSCASNAVAPTLPTILDNCSRPLSASAPVISPDPACEGTKTYSYTFTDCGGASYPWTYTYTIDYTGGLTPPANGSSTVSCPSTAVNPGAPANIIDACGRTVIPVLVGQDAPSPACEGNVVWRYRYTACDGTTTADWTHTYTIDYSGGLTPPANGSSTVSCPSAAVNPGAPANILDACGRTVIPVLVGQDAPTPACEGTVVWRYRYTACDGTTTADWTYTYTIDYSGGLTPPANGSSTVICPSAAVDPGAPANITDACGRIVAPVLIGQDAATPSCEGTVVWRYRYTACDGTTSVDWTYTYTIDYSGALTAPANGSSTVTCPSAAVNPGAPANITDACGRTVVPVLVGSTQTPDPVTCEGTIVWTYRYTACDGVTTADWTHTYTIDYSGALTAPANGSSIVTCPSAAVNPGAPANITDACGRTVVPVLVGSTQTPDPVTCEGTIVWTYRYTACDGVTTADWTHTYTIDYSGGLTPPSNGNSTISCPSAAIDPGAPANITDACGRTVVPVLVGSTQTPDPVTCEGSIVWTYRYTACDGVTTADWTYTYTIDLPSLNVPYSDGSATVSCPADAVDPGDPGVVTDACGNVLTPVVTAPSAVGCSGGTMDWVYTYTDCAGNSDAWTFSYTVSMLPFSIATADGSSTVNCSADAMIQPAGPGVVNDQCGNAITPVITAPTAIACEGTMDWIFTYTDCAGNSDVWTYTYTVDIPAFTIGAANGSSTVNCAADAQVQPTAPTVTDACGNTLTPVVTTPSALACEGTMDWVFTYTDCAGNTADWTYTYTVDVPAFTIGTANGASIVNCLTDAQVQPTAPTVTDACGNNLTPAVTTPADVSCEGTMDWVFTYTDCAGNSADWTYTYTIDLPAFTIASPNGSSTVNCISDAQIQPVAPTVSDLCGNVLTPVITSPPAIACEGAMIWDFAYTDCAGNTANWTYTYNVDVPAFSVSFADGSATVSCPTDAVDPGDPGVVTDACGNVLTPVVTAPSAVGCSGGTMDWVYTYTDCAGNSDAWTFSYTVSMLPFSIATADGSSTVNCSADAMIQPAGPGVVNDQCGNAITPVITAPTAIACEGTMDWIFTYTDCAGNSDVWTYTYTVDIPAFTIGTANGSSTVNCVADAQVQPTAPTVTDACGNTLTPVVTAPSALACEGTMDWVFTYTDCAGNTADWTYTYTVDVPAFTIGTANGASTVNCLTDAQVQPTAPTVTDACGNNLSPVVTTPADVSCEGTMDWVFTYTDCAGNTADWTYTYTIDVPMFTTGLTNGGTTVSCPADAVDPGDPGVVTDACGNTLTPVVTAPNLVDCNGGTMDWVYTYTDCAGNTIDWVYSYTVNMPSFTLPFADNGSTVNCLSEAQVQPIPPALVYDQCGNEVVPIVTTPADVTCEGIMDWIFTYTDCAGNSEIWTYSYTIDYISTLAAPTSGDTVVQCASDATDPGMPPSISDACGNTINAVLYSVVSTPDPIVCAGTVTFTYRYSACDGTFADWTFTYTVNDDINPTGSAPTDVVVNNSTDVPAVDITTVTNVSDNCSNPTVAWVSDVSDGVDCPETITRTYSITDDCGNSILVTQKIVVEGNCEIVIPSAFTPNGDLDNDVWDIIYLDEAYPNNIVMVYNRWGNLIYESDKGAYANKKWDGTYNAELLPVGSYYYIILTEGDNSGEILKGTVSIIKK